MRPCPARRRRAQRDEGYGLPHNFKHDDGGVTAPRFPPGLRAVPPPSPPLSATNVIEVTPLTVPVVRPYGHNGAGTPRLPIQFPPGAVPTLEVALEAALVADITAEAYRVFATCLLRLPLDREWTSRAVQEATGLTPKGSANHLGALAKAGLLRARRCILNGADVYVYALVTR